MKLYEVKPRYVSYLMNIKREITNMYNNLVLKMSNEVDKDNVYCG